MSKKKGFTLIELISVIVILGLIAVIIIPIIKTTTENAERKAFEESARGLIKAAEIYYNEKDMKQMKLEDEEFDLPNVGAIEYNGKIHGTGKLKISSTGLISLAMSNGEYCATKGMYDKVSFSEDVSDCRVQDPNPIIVINDDTSECIKNPKEQCTLEEIKAGISMQIRVNDTDTPTFYAVSDDGSKLTLIMDRNIGGIIAWITQSDYEAAGGTNYGSYGNNEKGPITVLNYLAEQTSTWSNINFNYILKDDGGKYTSVEKIGVHSRILTEEEIRNLGCRWNVDDSCPSWLYINTYNHGDNTNDGYWLSTARSNKTDSAYYVNFHGYEYSIRVSHAVTLGIRPAIEIPKSI